MMGALILVSLAAGIASFVVSGFIYTKTKNKTNNKLLKILFYILCVISGFVAGLCAGAIVVSIARGLPENTLMVMLNSALFPALFCPAFKRK